MAKYASLNNWTPGRARMFARRRLEKIRHLLSEISACYGDVDESVVQECETLIESGFLDLEEFLDDSLAQKRGL